MINIEYIANKITQKLYADYDMDAVEKAKIEYGFSISFGVAIELTLALLISLLLGTVAITLLMMISALVLRMNTGGAHCSSYDRCLIFTLLTFIPLSALLNFILTTQTPEIVLIISVCFFAAACIFLLGVKKKMTMYILLYAVVTTVAANFFDNMFLTNMMLATASGMLVQAFMATKPGDVVVNIADKFMKIIHI
ncbi:MAG: hypothetical protein FH749_02350 [Firmicutes bacterium]|nr:hypothetical protein [Bacillota bacterium]